MKILYVGLARSIWLFDSNLMNPKGLSFQPVIDALTQRYQFAKSPKNALDYDEQKTLSFRAGTFLNSKAMPILLVRFAIYSDGLVADTLSSTDDSTEFLEEIKKWMANEYGTVIPSEVRKAYLSQMDVECDTPLVRLNPRFEVLLKSINSRLRTGDGLPRQYDLGGINFWTEDATVPNAPAIIKFERKLPAPFSTNHYFSQTPFETKGHTEFLDELEQTLRGGKD